MLNRSDGDIYRLSLTTAPRSRPPATGATTTGTGTGTTVTGTGTGTTVAGNGTTTTGTGTTGTGSTVTPSSPWPRGDQGVHGPARPSPTVQPGSSPAAQQRPGGGPMYGRNPQMAGPQPNFNGPRVQQPNMAGPRVQPNMAGPTGPAAAGPARRSAPGGAERRQKGCRGSRPLTWSAGAPRANPALSWNQFLKIA